LFVGSFAYLFVFTSLLGFICTFLIVDCLAVFLGDFLALLCVGCLAVLLWYLVALLVVHCLAVFLRHLHTFFLVRGRALFVIYTRFYNPFCSFVSEQLRTCFHRLGCTHCYRSPHIQFLLVSHSYRHRKICSHNHKQMLAAPLLSHPE